MDQYCRSMAGGLLWSEYVPSESYVGILMPNVMVLGGGAFGKRLGREGSTLMIVVSDLIKKTPQSFLAPSIIGGCSEELAAGNLEEGLH